MVINAIVIIIIKQDKEIKNDKSDGKIQGRPFRRGDISDKKTVSAIFFRTGINIS